MNLEKFLTRRNTIIFVGLLTLWKLYISGTMQLHQDEAYYWLWSKRLAWGYYDHAPLIAWVIKLTTLFSQAELWVRFSGTLGTIIMSVLIWLLSMQLFGQVMVAAASVILLNISPLTISGSIIITPDIPAFFFWSVAVYLYWQLVRTQKPVYWYLVGAAFGLSLLSKYTSVLLAPSLLLCVVFSDERRWLKTPHPWLAFLMGSAFFLPVIFWNRAHDWISFRFQMGHGLGGETYSLGRLFEYIGGQMMIASPIVWVAGMWAGLAYLFRKEKEKQFLVFTSLPVLFFFGYASLKKPAGPNWPAAAYFTFSILAAKFLLDGGKARKAWLALAMLTCLGMSLLVTLHARFTVLPLAKWSKEWARADATNFFYGWKEVADEIMAKYPDVSYVLTPSHQYSAELSYYTREKLYTYIDIRRTRPSQFNLWEFPAELKDKKGLYVDVIEDDNPSDLFRKCFAATGEPAYLPVERNRFTIRLYRLIPGEKYSQ